jgi:glycosyltransferase involved in cell wall biosynthesis
MYFHPLVPHRELLSRIAEHDIGLATEENLPPSRDLTITNKILQYILGGIAVVASDTKGQQEVASEAEGAVFLYKNRDAGSLVSAISALAGSGEKLAAAKHAALESARKKFCWEQQKAQLTDRVRNLLMDK